MTRLATHSTSFARRRRRGLTLIEALVASVLFAFGALAALAGITAAWQQQQIALEEATAIQLAEANLERVAAKPYNRTLTNPTSRDPDSAEWANEMDGHEELVDALPGAGDFNVKLLIDEHSYGGSSIGQATVVVDTPSGQQIRLRRLLPTVDD